MLTMLRYETVCMLVIDDMIVVINGDGCHL